MLRHFNSRQLFDNNDQKYLYKIRANADNFLLFDIQTHYHNTEFTVIESKQAYLKYIDILTNNLSLFKQYKNHTSVMDTFSPKTATHEKYLLKGYLIRDGHQFEDCNTWYSIELKFDVRTDRYKDFSSYQSENSEKIITYNTSFMYHFTIINEIWFKDNQDALYVKLRYPNIGSTEIKICIRDSYLLELDRKEKLDNTVACQY